MGIALWTGVNVMTVKLMFLWTFIAFGFLTLIFNHLLHVFGSSVIKLLARLQSAEKRDTSAHTCTEEDLVQRRQQALKKKQVLQDDKTQFFQETVLQPRKDAELERKNEEFYKFAKLWRGSGYKLKDTSGEWYVPHGDVSESTDGQTVTAENLLSKEDEMTDKDDVSGGTLLTDSLRHRTSDKYKQTKMDDYYKEVSKSLPTEPPIGSVGVITVALRCPNGNVSKRRFAVKSQVQGLITFAMCLGFPPSQYVILKTYPRESLSNVTQTFEEAGLTHDVALVIEAL